MAKRLKAMGAAHYRDGFALRTYDAALEEPLRWKSPRKVFVNSMSDLFHKDVPLEFIQRAFDVMAQCPPHQFQILAKRAARLRELAPALNWAPNIWMGVSAEDQRSARRPVDPHFVPAHSHFYIDRALARADR
jgi:protein gp37